jgi:hypothetical protein
MLDILSTAELTLSASIAVCFLSLAMAQTARGRATVLLALGAWFVLVLAIGATGALSPAGGGAPALGLTVMLPIAALVGAYFALPPIRDAMAATPLPALIGLHAIRLLGYTFIVLYAEGRLPAPFAPSAGLGDMFIGATALPLAWAFMRFGARVRALVLLWNALGVADLVVALTLGPLSAPGSASGFRWTARLFANDHFALAHHSRLSGPDPAFHPRRHLRSAACKTEVFEPTYVWRRGGATKPP